MKQKKKSNITALLDYAGNHKGLTFLGLGLSAVSMLLSMAPYLCIWLAARDLIAAAPDWMQAQNVARYGWLAFGTAFGGIVLYFGGLMCTHLAAFRTAANIRKRGVAHMMDAPLGYFDANATGLIRGRLDAAAADTETLLAHNLADIIGTVTLFIAMLVMMFVFDWRMGCACLLAAVISILTMFAMMGGKNAQIMAEYQAAQDRMTKAGTDHVCLLRHHADRGRPHRGTGEWPGGPAGRPGAADGAGRPLPPHGGAPAGERPVEAGTMMPG